MLISIHEVLKRQASKIAATAEADREFRVKAQSFIKGLMSLNTIEEKDVKSYKFDKDTFYILLKVPGSVENYEDYKDLTLLLGDKKTVGLSEDNPAYLDLKKLMLSVLIKKPELDVSSYTPSEALKALWPLIKKGLFSVYQGLVHELIHYLDIKRRKSTVPAKPGYDLEILDDPKHPHFKEEFAKYLKDPYEFNALYQTAFFQISDILYHEKDDKWGKIRDNLKDLVIKGNFNAFIDYLKNAKLNISVLLNEESVARPTIKRLYNQFLKLRK